METFEALVKQAHVAEDQIKQRTRDVEARREYIAMLKRCGRRPMVEEDALEVFERELSHWLTAYEVVLSALAQRWPSSVIRGKRSTT